MDESVYRKNTIRNYGYSIRGMPAIDYRIKFGGVRVNAIGQFLEWKKLKILLKGRHLKISVGSVSSCPLTVVVMDNCLLTQWPQHSFVSHPI